MRAIRKAFLVQKFITIHHFHNKILLIKKQFPVKLCVVDGKGGFKKSGRYCPLLDHPDSRVECVLGIDRYSKKKTIKNPPNSQNNLTSG